MEELVDYSTGSFLLHKKRAYWLYLALALFARAGITPALQARK